MLARSLESTNLGRRFCTLTACKSEQAKLATCHQICEIHWRNIAIINIVLLVGSIKELSGRNLIRSLYLKNWEGPWHYTLVKVVMRGMKASLRSDNAVSLENTVPTIPILGPKIHKSLGLIHTPPRTPQELDRPTPDIGRPCYIACLGLVLQH